MQKPGMEGEGKDKRMKGKRRGVSLVLKCGGCSSPNGYKERGTTGSNRTKQQEEGYETYQKKNSSNRMQDQPFTQPLQMRVYKCVTCH